MKSGMKIKYTEITRQHGRRKRYRKNAGLPQISAPVFTQLVVLYKLSELSEGCNKKAFPRWERLF